MLSELFSGLANGHSEEVLKLGAETGAKETAPEGTQVVVGAPCWAVDGEPAIVGEVAVGDTENYNGLQVDHEGAGRQ